MFTHCVTIRPIGLISITYRQMIMVNCSPHIYDGIWKALLCLKFNRNEKALKLKFKARKPTISNENEPEMDNANI